MLSVGGGVKAYCDEEHSETVGGGVAAAAGGASAQFNDSVDGFGGAVAGSACVEADHTYAERQQPDGNPPSQRADHTNHNDQATQSSR